MSFTQDFYMIEMDFYYKLVKMYRDTPWDKHFNKGYEQRRWIRHVFAWLGKEGDMSLLWTAIRFLRDIGYGVFVSMAPPGILSLLIQDGQYIVVAINLI